MMMVNCRTVKTLRAELGVGKSSCLVRSLLVMVGCRFWQWDEWQAARDGDARLGHGRILKFPTINFSIAARDENP